MISEAIQIRTFEQKHFAEASRIHLETFPGFFLSSLGPRFLREFYRAFAFDRSSIAIVAENSLNGEVLGFAVGMLDSRGFFKRLLLKRWWAFGLLSLPAISKRPTSVTRILRAFLYRGDPPIGKKRALLSSIAVTSGAQKIGLGSSLLREWVRCCSDRGASGCYLTTDAADNNAVNEFYTRNGWRIDAEFITPEARKMFRYVLDIE
jgi:ribosomal protein S18 acetylase RimI-like enzyme